MDSSVYTGWSDLSVLCNFKVLASIILRIPEIWHFEDQGFLNGESKVN